MVSGAFALSAVALRKGEAYPTRPITVTVPFPAGGVLDLVEQIKPDRIRASLRQTIIVDDVVIVTAFGKFRQ
jgi:tripartite-type tricarboxylate transporter receptor subunit TctC